MKRSALAIAIVALAGCADAGGDAAAVTAALGQPNGDYPGYEERVVLYATNRARVDPGAEGWASYPAQPPLQWNYDLNRSARAHSLDMRDTPCFQHESCDGTDPFVRIATFYMGPMRSAGENIAGGVADPFTVVHNWINEIGAAQGETGHRDNIFSSMFTLMGAGFAPGAMAGAPPRTMANYWTQDFIGTTLTRPPLTDGIHTPKGPASGASVTFGTTVYDASGAGPSRVFVVVDGTCTPLKVARGTAALGAYEATLAPADGCHGYYFLATVGGADGTYPDSGALQVGVGADAASCALFAASRTPGDCGGGNPAGGTSGTTGAGGQGVGGSGATGAAGAGGASGSPGQTGNDVGGGCGCALPGSGGAGWLAVLGLALLLARRRVARAGQQPRPGQRSQGAGL